MLCARETCYARKKYIMQARNMLCAREKIYASANNSACVKICCAREKENFVRERESKVDINIDVFTFL